MKPWLSVKHAVPDADVCVLGFHAETDAYYLVTWEGNWWADAHSQEVRTITHWRPLDSPAAPQLLPVAASDYSADDDLMPILRAVSERLNVPAADLVGKCRKAAVCEKRFIFSYLAYTLTNHSSTAIGRFLGGRDHGTILSAIRRARDLMELYPSFARAVADLRATLSIHAHDSIHAIAA